MGVTGIGGLFFRAQDPDALAIWYREKLNIGAGCSPDPTDAADARSWNARGGPTIFAPFKATTDYFPEAKAFMINFRVDDLDALLDRLRQEGVAVETRAEWDDPSTGRFARIHDPEGNPVELWEPPR